MTTEQARRRARRLRPLVLGAGAAIGADRRSARDPALHRRQRRRAPRASRRSAQEAPATDLRGPDPSPGRSPTADIEGCAHDRGPLGSPERSLLERRLRPRQADPRAARRPRPAACLGEHPRPRADLRNGGALHRPPASGHAQARHAGHQPCLSGQRPGQLVPVDPPGRHGGARRPVTGARSCAATPATPSPSPPSCPRRPATAAHRSTARPRTSATGGRDTRASSAATTPGTTTPTRTTTSSSSASRAGGPTPSATCPTRTRHGSPRIRVFRVPVVAEPPPAPTTTTPHTTAPSTGGLQCYPPRSQLEFERCVQAGYLGTDSGGNTTPATPTPTPTEPKEGQTYPPAVPQGTTGQLPVCNPVDPHPPCRES